MKNPVVFLGLFLMAFALYANERRQLEAQPKTKSEAAGPISATNENGVSVITVPPSSAPPVVETARTADPQLKALFQSFLQDSIFSGRTDGIRIALEPEGLLIQLSGDDVFAEGEPSVRESWYPAIDRIAEKLTPAEFKKGLKVEVRGFADEASEKERSPGDFGHSDFLFSFSRAEWLARYFERKWRMPLKEVFTIKAMGARPYGKKVELWLNY